MKSVLISIQPKWCELIASGEKTIEVRKTRPKIETPFRCYIYETKARSDMPTFIDEDGHVIYTGRGQVIGEFICDNVDEYNFHEGLTEFNSMGLPSRIYGTYFIFADDYKSMCLSYDEVKNYGKGKTLYGWHISDLKIYDKPKELREFYTKKTCNSCKKSGYESTACMYDEDCKVPMPITRPPQSYMFVEEVEQRIFHLQI